MSNTDIYQSWVVFICKNCFTFVQTGWRLLENTFVNIICYKLSYTYTSCFYFTNLALISLHTFIFVLVSMPVSPLPIPHVK